MDLISDTARSLAESVAATVADPGALRAMLFAAVIGLALTWIGGAVARRVGILSAEAPDGEAVAIGLSTGLLILATTTAAIASSGRSAFTPVAVAFVTSILLSFRSGVTPSVPTVVPGGRLGRPPSIPTAASLTAFVLLAGLLYGATLAPSPGDGVQPVEFMDNAFYAILGRDIVATGVEAFYSPSGFASPPGAPSQNWYHWGELWLSGGIGLLPGLEPSFARHLVVLPLILLASAALTGSLARRAIGSSSRLIYLLGFAIGLLLAPIPVIGTDNYFTTWASGMIFSVTMYGLAAVVVPMLMLLIVRPPAMPACPAATVFTGGLAASILPAHVAMAILGAAGALVATALHTMQIRLERGRWPRPTTQALRIAAAIAGTVALTIGWGVATGHGILGSGAAASVGSFNSVWQVAVVATAAGSVSFLAIPIAWALVRSRQRALAGILVTSMAVVAGGAVAWGARLAEFTMFHAFFGAIVLFATPAAAVAIVVLWQRLGSKARGVPRLLLVAVVVLQVELGIGVTALQLVQFSAHDYDPIPLDVVMAIDGLEPGAKVAYACHQYEEIVYWDPRLLSIDLHTGRRIVPLCFQADGLSGLIGLDGPVGAPSPQFPLAPQAALFPSAEARPAPEAVAAFMRTEGIGYIFVDRTHPNTLVPDAIPIITVGKTQLLRLP